MEVYTVAKVFSLSVPEAAEGVCERLTDTLQVREGVEGVQWLDALRAQSKQGLVNASDETHFEVLIRVRVTDAVRAWIDAYAAQEEHEIELPDDEGFAVMAYVDDATAVMEAALPLSGTSSMLVVPELAAPVQDAENLASALTRERTA